MRGNKAGELLERAAELGALQSDIGDAERDRGSVLLIEGHAGIGKTRLLEVAAQEAVSKGFTALTARGSDIERDFAFGVVRQLFEVPLARSTPEERTRLLQGAAGLTASLFGLDASRGPPMEGPDAQAAILHGLYWLTVNFSERSALLIVLDDAHWADAPSLRFIAFLAHRLEGLGIIAALAARPTEPGPQRSWIEALKQEPAVRALRPAPLSPPGVANLVRGRLKGADEEFCLACHVASGGNPFLLNELVLEVERQGIAPNADQAPRLSELAPENVKRSAISRIAAVSAQATALAHSASVLESGQLIAVAALAGLSLEEASATADELVSNGIFESLEPVRFAHPLLRAALYAHIPEGGRALFHARAAKLLFDGGAPLDDVAAQLLRAQPSGESWVGETLLAAAEEARGRRAPDVCARYLRRLLEEPMEQARRIDLILFLGQAEVSAGIPNGLEHLKEVFERARPPDRRADAALTLARALGNRGETKRAAELLARGSEELRDSAPEQARRLDVELLMAADADLSLRPQFADRLERAAAKPAEHEGPLASIMLAHRAVDALSTGASAKFASDLAAQVLEDESFARATAGSQFYFLMVYTLLCADRFELARRFYEIALSEARARGSVAAFVVASAHRSYTGVRTGALHDADADARSAVDAARLNGLVPLELMSVAALMFTLVERELDAAAGLLADANVDVGSLAHVQAANFLMGRGRVNLELGNHEAAAADLCEAGARFSSWGMRNPGVWPWRSEAALALNAIGQSDRAHELVGEELELARQWGAPRAIGIALRAGGLIEGGDAGLELLREAVAVLEPSRARLEHARALTDLGAALRRSNRRAEAREPLRQGLDLARRCGATVLAERAAEELAATGARPRRVQLSGVEALTPTERRIASLASEGRSNPEIAQSLFVTRKTVEFHLSNAYRKLDISTRAELAHALSAPAQDQARVTS